MGLGGEKRREHGSKIELVLAQKEEGEMKKEEMKQPKKDPILERGGERVYVLAYMVVTFPTCHLEMSALKVRSGDEEELE